MLVDVSGSTEGDRDSFVTEALAILRVPSQKLMVNNMRYLSEMSKNTSMSTILTKEMRCLTKMKSISLEGGTNFDAPFNV